MTRIASVHKMCAVVCEMGYGFGMKVWASAAAPLQDVKWVGEVASMRHFAML